VLRLLPRRPSAVCWQVLNLHLFIVIKEIIPSSAVILQSSRSRVYILPAAAPPRCLASRQPSSLQQNQCWRRPSPSSPFLIVVTSFQCGDSGYGYVHVFLSPFTFEYEVNPVIHRPYLQTSKYLATIGSDRDVSGGYPPTLGESSDLDVAQNIDAIPSTPSTRFTSPNNASTSWLETPATSPSTNTSPLSSVVGPFAQGEGSSFTCCHCQEVFHRRCDLK
jgi:hypothetical protein